jgi:hypothetical protein
MWGCASPSQEEADEAAGQTEEAITVTSVGRGADGKMVPTMTQVSQREFRSWVELRSSMKRDVDTGTRTSALVATGSSLCGSWDSTWFFDQSNGTGNLLCVMWQSGGSWPDTAELSLVNVPHPSGNWAGRIRFIFPGSQEGFFTDLAGTAGFCDAFINMQWPSFGATRTYGGHSPYVKQMPGILDAIDSSCDNDEDGF